MNSRSQLLAAYDLKSAYQRNMLIGFGFAGGLHLLIIGVTAIVIANSNMPVKAPTIVLRKPTDILRPPTIKKPDEQIRIRTPQNELKPAVGIPTPVPDDEAPEDREFISQKDIAGLAPDNPVENLEGLNIEVDIESIRQELFPDPGEFVPREVDPVQISSVKPVYPLLAQRAGMEGVVWINALVDKEGKVRDVIIVKESGANAGFEEAAMDAAYKTTWKPAIANGQPIALWVTYKVEFVLK